VKGHPPLSSDLDRKVEALKTSLMDLGAELKDKEDVPADRITAIEAEIETKAAQLDQLLAEKREKDVDAKLAELDERMKAFNTAQAKTKAAAILAGVEDKTRSTTKSVGKYNEGNFLSALVDQRVGDPDAREFVKAVLGTSLATGTAVLPNNFVGSLIEALSLSNPYREVFDVVTGVTGASVDIPYSATAITPALLQGAYGSNKDIRDFGFARATATLYTIAQIVDIGNQLLRQSNGAAEKSARNRLAASIGMAEAAFITNGSGSSQPLGFWPAINAYGAASAITTTLSSEPRLATMAKGIAAMESRGAQRRNLVFAMNPTDYWETAAEGLGTSYAGGWAVDPANGASRFGPITEAWGVRLLSDPSWPAAQANKGLLIDTTDVTIFTGQEYRIDVSSEAGNRFDQNITGFRAEEEFGFNAEPYVRSGRVQIISGI